MIPELSTEAILFFILYGISGVVPLMAAVYLLLRRANAIAPGVSSPVRLRRWTASFFGVSALAHVWWLLFYIYSGDLQSVSYMVLVILDFVLLFTTFVGMLLAMLQDRRRPMWPFTAALIPFVAMAGVYVVYPLHLIVQIEKIYLLLLSLSFAGYLTFAIRQYGRWLNDNYADLENKKVWLSQTVSLSCMMMFVLYTLADDIVLIYVIHLIELVLTGLLLWRVETLQTLEETLPQPITESLNLEIDELSPEKGLGEKSLVHIEQLLKERCEDKLLYLQHDLSLQLLAQTVGTNRSYLSQYFSRQGITYNAYINNLRINHFISRFLESPSAQQFISVSELAHESGYRSYSTFSLAFKQRMGQSVTAWMQESERKN